MNANLLGSRVMLHCWSLRINKRFKKLQIRPNLFLTKRIADTNWRALRLQNTDCSGHNLCATLRDDFLHCALLQPWPKSTCSGLKPMFCCENYTQWDKTLCCGHSPDQAVAPLLSHLANDSCAEDCCVVWPRYAVVCITVSVLMAFHYCVATLVNKYSFQKRP